MGALIAGFGIYLPFDTVNPKIMESIGTAAGCIAAGAAIYWVFSGFAVPKQ